MGRKNVKNTIVERLLQFVAPHHCCGCGKVGVVLCDYCKYNITHEPFMGCFWCGWPAEDGICSFHAAYGDDTTKTAEAAGTAENIKKSFIVSQRSGVLEALINDIKFHHVKAAARALAELLDERLPILPPGTIIVPIPTVWSHIRQRGYDQVELIARHLAQRRGLRLERVLQRVGTATQHKLGRQERFKAARRAFGLKQAVIAPAKHPHRISGASIDIGEKMLTDAPILLIDDIITTGATIENAALALKPLGLPIFVAALAYQPLD